MPKPLSLPIIHAIAAKTDGKVQLIRTDYGVDQDAGTTVQSVALKFEADFAIIANRTAP